MVEAESYQMVYCWMCRLCSANRCWSENGSIRRDRRRGCGVMRKGRVNRLGFTSLFMNSSQRKRDLPCSSRLLCQFTLRSERETSSFKPAILSIHLRSNGPSRTMYSRENVCFDISGLQSDFASSATAPPTPRLSEKQRQVEVLLSL